MPLRFEAWTHPGSGTFEKKFDIPVAMPGSAGVRELSAWSDESIMVPASYSRLPDLVSETSGSWIKAFHRSTLLDEFDAARVSLTAGAPNTRTVSGPQRNGLVEGVGILPKNYPNHKAGAFDWKWGAENVLPSLDLADLGSIRAEYELYNDETAGGTFTVTVEAGGSSDTTESLDFDVTAAGLEGSVPADTGIQGLSTVNDVAVSGSGTSDDPWVITFYDPTAPDSVSVTDANGLTSTLTENEGGRLDPSPITKSKPVDAGAGSEDEHGSYGDPAVGVSKAAANLDTDADWALRVKAESRFAGSQLIVDVTPGETYSASIRVKPDTTGTFKFVFRDLFGNHIDQAGGTLTAGSYQELSIDDMVIPANINQVIMRIAAVDDTPANIDWFYVNWQHAELITGDPEATWTQIVRELLEEAQDRGAGTFLELDATDDEDTNGTSLSTMSFTQYVGDNAHLGQTLGTGREKGFHWQVSPADDAQVITPDSSTTHVLQIYKVDADEIEDLTATSGGPTVTVGGKGVSEAQVVSRRIPYTTMIGLGTGSVSKENSSAAAETALGRIERVVDVEHLGSEDSVEDYLTAQFAEQALNLKAATATVLESASQIPGVDYGPGSKIWWQFPGILDKEARPVKRFSWTHGLTAQFRIEGSRILTGEAAVVSAVDMLLRKQGRRRHEGGGLKASDLQNFIKSKGQSIHVTASESIPDDTATEITFDNWVGATTHGFDVARASMPTHSLTAPFTAISQATVRVTWDDVTDGGWQGDGVRARLKLNGSTVDEWQADDPALFPIAPLQADSVKLPVAIGDGLTLELYQNSGEARDATVELSWGLEDQTLEVKTPGTVTVQARVWEDGTTEPSTWDVEATTDVVSGDLFPALVVGDLSDDGDRRADWVGWGPTGSAPVQGESGKVTDFDEAAHTLGQPPAGWTQIVGTDRVTVQSLASSNTSGGQAAVSDNWAGGNDRGVILWTDASPGDLALGVIEVTAVLESGQSDRNPPSVGVVNEDDEGWQVQPSSQANSLILRSRVDGQIDSAAVTVNTDTWYRVRLRVTPGG